MKVASTINEQFASFRRTCEELAKKYPGHKYAPYMCGSKQKKNKLSNLIEQYKRDIDIDTGLGILESEEIVYLLKAHEIMEQSMKNFKEY